MTNSLYTPLHKAAWNDSLADAKLLIADDADLNAKYGSGITPLHITAWNDSFAVAKLLIDSGANFYAKYGIGYTPLHACAIYNSVKVAELLLANGANKHEKDESDNSPLHLTSELKDSVEVAELLIKKGAKVDAINVRGETPLHSAARGSCAGIAKLLIDYDAEMRAKDKRDCALVHVKDNRGRTPVHFAIQYADKKTIELFEEYTDIKINDLPK